MLLLVVGGTKLKSKSGNEYVIFKKKKDKWDFTVVLHVLHDHCGDVIKKKEIDTNEPCAYFAPKRFNNDKRTDKIK